MLNHKIFQELKREDIREILPISIAKVMDNKLEVTEGFQNILFCGLQKKSHPKEEEKIIVDIPYLQDFLWNTKHKENTLELLPLQNFQLTGNRFTKKRIESHDALKGSFNKAKNYVPNAAKEFFESKIKLLKI